MRAIEIFRFQLSNELGGKKLMEIKLNFERFQRERQREKNFEVSRRIKI